MKQEKSWKITETFWEAVKGLIPKAEREEGKEYKRAPGGGRKPMDPRYGEAALEAIVLRGYIPHVVSRGEEKQNIENNPEFKARRWVVERVFSWLNLFRKILVRYEKYAFTYMGLLQFACAFITFR
jgi:transposase